MTSQALTTQPGTAPLAARDNSEHGKFKRQLQTREADFRAVLASKGISVRDFLGSIMTAVAQNPDLISADRSSLVLSCLRAAQDGLHPDGREAALVIFSQRRKNEQGRWETVKAVQYMPMVYGLRKKILQAKDAIGKPVVSALQVGVVYRAEVEQGYFLWERGSDPEVQHRPMLEIPEEETTDDKIVAAYSIATMSDGTRSCEVMRRFEINKVRQMSQTGAEGQTARYDDDKNGIKRGDPVPPKGPWADWFPEMAKKTVMRRHSKTLPMSGDVIASLGDEDENQYAASALAITGGQGEPAQIEDASGDKVDPETGEILEEGGNGGEAGGDQGAKAEGQPEPEKKGGGRKAQAEPEKGKAEPEKTEEPTRDPAEGVAERLLGEFAKAKDEDALEKLWNGSELERAAMWDDTHSAVLNGFNRHVKRVRELEPAGAK